MSVFGDSQVRNLFVDNKFIKAANATAAATQVKWHMSNGNVVINQVKGGETRASQSIDPKNVISAGFNSFKPNKSSHTVAFTTNAAKGDSFEVVCYIENYGASNGHDAGMIRGVYTAVGADTPTTIVVGLKDSLDKAIAKEQIKGITTSKTTGTLTVVYDRSDFNLGKFDGSVVKGRVLGRAFSATTSVVNATTYAPVVSNGTEIANLEWFMEGNVGDIYRGVGYPNNFDTAYLADASKQYGVYEIAFYTERMGAPGDKQRQMLTIAVVEGAANPVVEADFDTLKAALGQ